MGIPDNPHKKIQDGLETGLTQNEYRLLAQCKAIIPDSFKREADDWRILAFIKVVIDDINYIPPLTGYTIENFPPFMDTIVVLGVNAWIMYFTIQILKLRSSLL